MIRGRNSIYHDFHSRLLTCFYPAWKLFSLCQLEDRTVNLSKIESFFHVHSETFLVCGREGGGGDATHAYCRLV